MTQSVPASLSSQLTAAGQSHLIEYCERLSPPDAQRFTEELQSVDWDLVTRLVQQAFQTGVDESVVHLAQRATPPSHMIRLPRTADEQARWRDARERGWNWLRAGKVGMVVVAGGQGTRLGSSDPKGMFPIGPLTGKSLFQWFCEGMRKRRSQTGQPIPYAVMTSAATHIQTAAFLKQHDYFGLPATDVQLFQQGHLPAVDSQTGQVLLSGPAQMALSPDGHGGMLAGLSKSRILSDWAARGIETIFYHQIDNPSTPLCDPAFIGFHLETGAEVSTKVVAKKNAAERMGVVVDVDGVSRIIEYSDLPAEIAAATEPDGSLRIWAGNTAMHLFQREFLERALLDTQALPFHVAKKAVPHLNTAGELVQPTAANAFKFERFIFDVLPWAETALVVEGDRAAEFNPVKNREGSDSPETSKAALMAQHRQWLRAAGATVVDNIPVEISPLVALEASDLQGQLPAGLSIDAPLSVTPEQLELWNPTV